MIKRMRYNIYNAADGMGSKILIFYYHPINTSIKIFKNDLPISISINVYYNYSQGDKYLYSHRDNDLPSYVRINDSLVYIFKKYNIQYRYSGYADMFLINNTKRLKFIRGICLEELKRSIDYD